MTKKMKATNLYVAENRILVKPEDAPDKTEGGIYLTDTSKESQRKAGRGTIVAVGIRRIESTGQRFDSQFSEGQIAVYGRYSGTDVTIDGQDYVVVREEDVLLILPPA